MFDTQAAFFLVSFQLETCANETIHAPVLGCMESGILRSPENEGSTGLGYDVGWTLRGRHSGETSDSGGPPACDGVSVGHSPGASTETGGGACVVGGGWGVVAGGGGVSLWGDEKVPEADRARR